MNYKTNQEIIKTIENQKDELTAVEIIGNHKNTTECSVILNDKLFSIPYETDFNFGLIMNIKQAVNNDTLVIYFNDIELPNAWKLAYQEGGILERFPDDRRLEFHPYNDMNEQFCIDRTLLWDITDEFKGTDHEITEENCKWRFEIVKWYKNHLI